VTIAGHDGLEAVTVILADAETNEMSARPEGARTPRPGLVLQLGSITNISTAILAMRPVDEGNLDLGPSVMETQ
jgi:hypothetical protein